MRTQRARARPLVVLLSLRPRPIYHLCGGLGCVLERWVERDAGVFRWMLTPSQHLGLPRDVRDKLLLLPTPAGEAVAGYYMRGSNGQGVNQKSQLPEKGEKKSRATGW